jgi:hypothetical protein
MKNRIRDAFENMDENMLREVNRSLQKRLQLCINQGGRHFEDNL